MKYKNTLLTGGSGKLGTAILVSGHFPEILSPPHEKLDLCNIDSIRNFLNEKPVDAVIHCAALTSMPECEKNPANAVNVNIIGTSNLVNEILKKEQDQGNKIRFIHISTDAVYEREDGNYSENSPTIPNSIYGWSKLGGECAVNALSNHCIIRTSFFDPKKLKFTECPNDVYTSKLAIAELADAIKLLLESDFTGTINVGNKRISNYDLFKKYVPELKSCKLSQIEDKLPAKLPKDSSMNVELWEKIKNDNL
ncbi:sugar nucleotide-binding protein [Candidatus Pacearchaeota archaeon]|nr:sugar nucleotide-binding protein [Candidatus Pacearchaeota archaeon]